MASNRQPKFEIPDDLFDNPKQEAKVEAVQKLANKEPARLVALIRKLLNKDTK